MYTVKLTKLVVITSYKGVQNKTLQNDLFFGSGGIIGN